MKKALPFFISQAITLFGLQFFMSFAGGVWADRHSHCAVAAVAAKGRFKADG